MKFKLVCAVVLSALLSACGGHGFEGKWKMQIANDAMGGALAKMAQKLAGDTTLIIGDDYIESNGQRHEVDISIRESDDKRYLVMKDDNDNEQIFLIKDDNTLVQGNGFASINFKRVN
jgi:hypothetical protein